MAEATNPTPGVEHSEASILKRLGAVLEVSEDQAEEPPQRRAPEPQAPQAAPEPAEPAPDAQATDEPTPDDIPDEEAPAAAVEGGEFEIVHNGTQHRLSREDTIRYAQQGFDYTVKTQALAEKAKGVEAALQRAAEVEQLAPLIAGEQAQLIALRARLEPYKETNWVQLATDYPLEYPKYRAEYDALVNAHDAVAQRVGQATHVYAQAKRQLTAQQLQQEFVRLPEFVPEWKSQAKYEADSKEVFEWLASKHVDMDKASKKLDDAFTCACAFMAMKYDKLLKSKGEKSKLLQSTPPVTRPGVPNTSNTAQASKEAQARARFRKTGSIEDGAALLVARMK